MQQKTFIGYKMIIENTKNLKILTPNGYKSFTGLIKRDDVEQLYEVMTESGKLLKCTKDHKLLDINNEIILLSKLTIGDLISTLDGLEKIKSIELSTNEIVYDLLEVDGGNIFYTNDIVSHNCEFLTEELTLVDGAVVSRYERMVQDKIDANILIAFTSSDSRFQFFKKLVKGATYIVGVDPCSGVGTDNGVIQVFEFPSMEQVLEYTNNTLSPHVMYTELKSVLNFLNKATDEIYFSIENNGVGQGILAAYEGDMNPPNAFLVSQQGKEKVGVNSNVKTKLRACLQFKDAFERNKMVINSPQLLIELKSFIRHAGSYAAQIGATDDRIMACMVVFYVIQELSQSNANAYDMVYTVASEIEERHSWSVDKESVQNPDGTYERSDALKALFESLHGDGDKNDLGFAIG